MTAADRHVRAWLRAPADGFVSQFGDDGPFGGLTQWVRAAGPALDLHLWSDASAAMHRARVVTGTVGLIDLAWSPHRFRIAARRPFTRVAGGWLDDAWHPTRAAAERVRRAVAFGEVARGLAASRAAFGIAALTGLGIVTQEYAPVLAAPLEATPEVAEIRHALMPPPIPGGEPFFASAPDAVAVGADGVIEFVRVYSARAPELRFAAAQAVADLDLFAALDPASRRDQLGHFDRVVAARARLGLPTTRRAAVDVPARARILASADLSPRLEEQFRSVQTRLVERGLLRERALRVEVVEAVSLAV
ncbi:hypothetical protein [Pseudolysinimonas sp.]|jgi:hypothetical protein|uniref:hypothetical protein n=1 Tax=Pseudolysinimonas sp. TaxID=2680009 RepID=UPI003784A763